jgi:DNA-binding response OmpR family regulator
MAKILLLEDDKDFSDIVAACLQANHIVEQCWTVQEARDKISFSDFELLVLDWNLPDGEGLSLLEDLRAAGCSTPALMMTAKCDINDKVKGFAAGSDDYLAKPFHLQELVARVGALLRRPPHITQEVLTVRNLTLDPKSHTVRIDGEEVKILPKEFALLEFLLRHPNQVYSNEQLLDKVWPSTAEVSPETVTTTIKRLRKKVDRPGVPSIIDNVFGVGYKITT